MTWIGRLVSRAGADFGFAVEGMHMNSTIEELLGEDYHPICTWRPVFVLVSI